MNDPVRIGLVGYGLAGRVFHAALYPAVPEVRLVAVASSDAAKVHADHPDVRVHPTPAALFADDEVELVVLATPSPTHAPLMREALGAGRHVLSDKPFAATVEEADAVIEAADVAGRVASCYQNRRYDADFLTLRRLLDDGELGDDVLAYESRFERFAPVPRERWQERETPATGLHHDLGSHLVDQMLALFGTPEWVQGDVQRLREGGAIVDTFHARFGQGERRMTLAAGMRVADHRLRFHVQGAAAAWRKEHLDPQEEQLRHEGLAVTDSGYGHEPPERYGRLLTPSASGTGIVTVPTERGDWPRLYRELARAVRTGAPPPVTAAEARETTRVISAIVESARTGRRTDLAR